MDVLLMVEWGIVITLIAVAYLIGESRGKEVAWRQDREKAERDRCTKCEKNHVEKHVRTQDGWRERA